MKWQQYFPTYNFDENKNRDIAIEEYKFCCKVIESEEKIFDNLIKYILIFGTIIISLLTGMSENLEKIFAKIIKIENSKLVWYFVGTVIILFFTLMTKNFADTQKAIIFAKRKVVVLRRMLGIDYGTQEFLFKKGRFEGANLPFSIRLSFHYLYYIIIILYLVALLIVGFLSGNTLLCVVVFALLTSTILICLYIYWILDLNETFLLVIFRVFFKLLGIKFVDNFEHILYRAKLSAYESKRQKINLDIPKRMLIEIEDRRFYRHKGIDCKAIGRALLSRGRKVPFIKEIPYIRKIPFSGGSTITQQLLRTLFIENIGKKILRRKLAEICLSYYWLNKILTKEEQLEIHLNVVRFDNKIFGIMEAMRHFYGQIKPQPSKAQCFFLIERISVTSGKILKKIVNIIMYLEENKFLNENDIKEIINIYHEAHKEGKIKEEPEGENILDELSEKYKLNNNITTS